MRTATARKLPALPESLSDILSRTSAGAAKHRPCGCPTCLRLRQTTFHCQGCGYEGAPLVHECSCDGEGREVIFAEWRAALERGTDAQGRRLTRAARTNLRAILKGYAARDRFGCPTGEDSLCAHGAVDCPVCYGASDMEPVGSDPWAIIRDLRAALAARGLA